MTFKCKNCEEKVSNSKMVGLVLGQVASATLEGKGIKTRPALTNCLNSGEVGAGVLSGMGVSCPNCNSANWD